MVSVIKINGNINSKLAKIPMKVIIPVTRNETKGRIIKKRIKVIGFKLRTFEVIFFISKCNFGYKCVFGYC